MSFKDEKYLVAIIGMSQTNGCYECGGSETITESITDWEELSWEELQLLQDGLSKLSNTKLNYRVVFKPTMETQKQIVIESIAHGRKLAKEALERLEKVKEEKLAKIKAREDKQRAKSEAQRKAEYERLKAEFETAERNLKEEN